MQSKQAFILALMAGASALIIVLAGLIGTSLVQTAGPYLSGRSQTPPKLQVTAPHLSTQTIEGETRIVELGEDGQVVRTIYSSEDKDHVANFSLFAVPQTRFNGLAYVESQQDLTGSELIVYPLDIGSGKIAQAVLNVASTEDSVSPAQDRVAVIDANAKTLTIYDIISGASLSTWTLDTRPNAATVTRWEDNNCFLIDTQKFCYGQ